MLRAEDNRFLTESGAGTPMGELLRRFWLPVLLSEELPEADGPPKKTVVPVRCEVFLMSSLDSGLDSKGFADTLSHVLPPSVVLITTSVVADVRTA